MKRILRIALYAFSIVMLDFTGLFFEFAPGFRKVAEDFKGKAQDVRLWKQRLEGETA